jgi:hypothetical protein
VATRRACSGFRSSCEAIECPKWSREQTSLPLQKKQNHTPEGTSGENRSDSNEPSESAGSGSVPRERVEGSPPSTADTPDYQDEPL